MRKLDDRLRLTVVLSSGGENLAIVRADNEAAEKDAVAGLEGLGYTILRVVEG